MDSGGVLLKGELTSPGVGGGTLVVLCHGIPLSPPDPVDAGYPGLALDICRCGHAALFFNMRGTGESGGNFHLGGWYRDLYTVMEFAGGELSGRFEKIVMAGFSAGGALAIRYVAEYGGVAGLATFAAPAEFGKIFPRESLFSFIELAREVGIIRELSFPPDPDSFYRQIEETRPVENVSRISPIPLLMIHGENDDLVPAEEGRKLFEAAREPKAFKLLAGGGHRLRQDPRSLACLLEWIETL